MLGLRSEMPSYWTACHVGVTARVEVIFTQRHAIVNRIQSTMVSIGGDIHRIDTIMLDDCLWLVPNWIDNFEEKYSVPERIIRLSPFELEATAERAADFILHRPLPVSLLFGQPTKAQLEEYEIRFRPDIKFIIPLDERHGGI